MNSIEGNSLFNFASSIGWLIDRTGEEEQILGTVWLAADRQAATCAIPVIPFAETLEALIVRFPCTRSDWGVKAAEFNPGCDRWMAKRAFASSLFYPPASLANQQHNVVILRLTTTITPLDSASKDRLNRLISRTLPHEESGFSGRATNVELTSVIQTLVNARRQGTIVICDPRKRPIARIFCESGRISHARYGEAINEDAIYKLMCSSFAGFFYFQQEKQPEWCDFPTMVKSTAALLLEAYRRLEDKTQALESFGGDSAFLFKTTDVLPNGGSPEAHTVWSYLYNGMPISRLLKVSNLDGSQTMKGLKDLVAAGYVTLSPAVPPAPFNMASVPLPMNLQTDLSPGSEIYAVSIDPLSGPYFASGKILGPRQSDDPWHQLHTVALPEEALGSPIFKGSEVIGMYCGGLVAGKYDPPEFVHTQQMLWVSSVNNCTGAGAFQVTGVHPTITVTGAHPTVTVTGANPTITVTGEQAALEDDDEAEEESEEVAVDERSTLVDLSRPAAAARALAAAAAEAAAAGAAAQQQSAGSRLRENMDTGTHKISSLLGSISAVFSKNRKPQTTQQWFDIDVTRTECGSTNWTKATSSTVFRAGDLLRLQIRMLQEAYLYALFQGSNSKNVTILYPDVLIGAAPLAKLSIIAIPNRQSDQTLSFKLESGKYSLLGLPILSTARGGTESLLLISSKTSLSPLLDSKNIATVFTNGTILLNGQRNLDLMEVEENALYEGGDIADVAANLICLAKLRVSHEV